MPRIAVRLTAAEVKTLPARTSPYWDGDGLGLRVRGAERAFWIYRYQIDREKRELGLGRARGPNAITLAAARAKHATLRAMVESGTHPPKAQEKKRAAAAAEAKAQAAGITFRGVADHYLKAHEASWGNPKHRKQWRTTLETYVMVALGPMPVSAVGTGEIMSILEPIWSMRPETASRVRGRIEAVLDYAAARGWRTGENPARWRGHLQKLLPARNKKRTVRHFAALPWQEAGAFMARLREQDGTAARAAEFAILTAARSAEAHGARWDEIYLNERVWRVPAARMKAGVQHAIPLSEPALVLLRRMIGERTALDSLIFPHYGVALGDRRILRAVKAAAADPKATLHGWRALFKTWATERTGFPREAIEMSLAHAVGDAVEQAYQRGDMLAKREKLMEAWGEFLAKPMVVRGDNIRAIRGAA